jgi:hypothetical protein
MAARIGQRITSDPGAQWPIRADRSTSSRFRVAVVSCRLRVVVPDLLNRDEFESERGEQVEVTDQLGLRHVGENRPVGLHADALDAVNRREIPGQPYPPACHVATLHSFDVVTAMRFPTRHTGFG